MTELNYVQKLAFVLDKFGMKLSMLASLLHVTEKTLSNTESPMAQSRVNKAYDFLQFAENSGIKWNYFSLIDNPSYEDDPEEEGSSGPNALYFISNDAISIDSSEWYHAKRTLVHIWKLEAKIMDLEDAEAERTL